MAMVAFADQGTRKRRALHGAPDLLTAVEEGSAVGPQQGPVVLLEIGDLLGKGGQRQGIGAQVHLALAIAHRQRRASPGAHQDVVAASEDDGQRKGTLEARHDGRHRLLGLALALELASQ